MKKVLIVDDDEELCVELRDVLKREGFEVDTVHDGTLGRQHMESGRYQLGILDLKLPGLNGYAVLKDIKKSGHPIKIFVLSGRPLAGTLIENSGDFYKEDGEEALKIADAVMNKPFMIDQFLNKVRELTSTKI